MWWLLTICASIILASCGTERHARITSIRAAFTDSSTVNDPALQGANLYKEEEVLAALTCIKLKRFQRMHDAIMAMDSSGISWDEVGIEPGTAGQMYARTTLEAKEALVDFTLRGAVPTPTIPCAKELPQTLTALSELFQSQGRELDDLMVRKFGEFPKSATIRGSADTTLTIPTDALALLERFGCTVAVGATHPFGGRNVLVTFPDGDQTIDGVQKVYRRDDEVHFYRRCPDGTTDTHGTLMYSNTYKVVPLGEDTFGIHRLDELPARIRQVTVVRWYYQSSPPRKFSGQA